MLIFSKSCIWMLRIQRIKPFFLIFKTSMYFVLYMKCQSFNCYPDTGCPMLIPSTWRPVFSREVRLGVVENSPVTQYSWLLYANGLIGCIIEASNWVSYLNSGNDTWCIISLQSIRLASSRTSFRDCHIPVSHSISPYEALFTIDVQ